MPSGTSKLHACFSVETNACCGRHQLGPEGGGKRALLGRHWRDQRTTCRTNRGEREEII